MQKIRYGTTDMLVSNIQALPHGGVYDEIEITFADQTYDSLKALYEMKDNPNFDAALLRNMKIFDSAIVNGVENWVESGTHIGYTIPTGIFFFNGVAKVTLRQESEEATRIAELESKDLDNKLAIAELYEAMINGGTV